MPNINGINAVFQKLLSGHHSLITDGRTHGRTNARTGVTLNAPPPFFEWRGHKKHNNVYQSDRRHCLSQWHMVGLGLVKAVSPPIYLNCQRPFHSLPPAWTTISRCPMLYDAVTPGSDGRCQQYLDVKEVSTHVSSMHMKWSPPSSNSLRLW